MPEIMMELSNIGHTQFKRKRSMKIRLEYQGTAIGTFEDHALYHNQIGLHLNNTSDHIVHYPTPEHPMLNKKLNESTHISILATIAWDLSFVYLKKNMQETWCNDTLKSLYLIMANHPPFLLL